MNTVDDVKEILFLEFGDETGRLVAIEGGVDINFEIKRVFYICDVKPGVTRGEHANRHSEFCLINICGNSSVNVVDSAGNTKIFTLDAPNKGLYIPSMIWKDMYNFSQDAILLVLSSHHYDSQEYVRDFNEFLKS